MNYKKFQATDLYSKIVEKKYKTICLKHMFFKHISAFCKTFIQFFRNIGDHYDEIGRLMRGEFELA
jgi:hypothetical protein